jgi:hypothetical protein
MPNPKEISGVPLPADDLTAGTVSVRVIRGSFANNLPGQKVEFTIDGAKRTVATDASGRAEVGGLKPGARVRAETVVDGERLMSQDVTIGRTGIRIVLVATDPEAAGRAAEDRALAAGPAVRGMVVLGGESRVIAEMSDDRLRIFYVLEIVNPARTPVDTGGPLIFDLPREARGAAVLEGSSKQATANGPRVTVTSPFAPGVTRVEIAYELPYDGPTAKLTQRWPATLDEVTVIVPQVGSLDVESRQTPSKRSVTEQGQVIIIGSGPAIPAGQALELAITGLPHHARWPRRLAVGLAGAIVAAGIWAAVFAGPRRKAA